MSTHSRMQKRIRTYKVFMNGQTVLGTVLIGQHLVLGYADFVTRIGNTKIKSLKTSITITLLGCEQRSDGKDRTETLPLVSLSIRVWGRPACGCGFGAQGAELGAAHPHSLGG